MYWYQSTGSRNVTHYTINWSFSSWPVTRPETYDKTRVHTFRYKLQKQSWIPLRPVQKSVVLALCTVVNEMNVVRVMQLIARLKSGNLESSLTRRCMGRTDCLELLTAKLNTSDMLIEEDQWCMPWWCAGESMVYDRHLIPDECHFSCLWTKVHQIWGLCREALCFPFSLSDCLWRVSYRRHSIFSLQVVEKRNKSKSFWPQSFLERWPQLLYHRLLARCTIQRLAKFGRVSFAGLRLRSLATK